jgi:hypothetical protein
MGSAVRMGDGWNSVLTLTAAFGISVLPFRVLLPYCYIVWVRVSDRITDHCGAWLQSKLYSQSQTRNSWLKLVSLAQM